MPSKLAAGWTSVFTDGIPRAVAISGSDQRTSSWGDLALSPLGRRRPPPELAGAPRTYTSESTNKRQDLRSQRGTAAESFPLSGFNSGV